MFESPFIKKKVVFKREPTFYERWRDFFLSRIEETFLQAIPSEDVKQMPPEYLYPLGLLLLSIVLAIFLAIFVPNYNYEISTKYLSPYDSTSTSTSKYCDTVPISNTGIYLATKEGQWQSTKGFSYSLAAYTLDITSFQVSQEEYALALNTAYSGLIQLGQTARNKDLAQNLLEWMVYVYLDPEYSSQRFYLVGDPINVFARQRTAGTLSGIHNDCNTNSSDASFDAANGALTLDYNYFDFKQAPSCQNIVDPVLLGYTSYANPSSFKLSLDVRTLVTALAVNLGIIDLRSLDEIPTAVNYFTINGTVYNTTGFVNPQFPNMIPVNCVRYPLPLLCVIPIDQAVGIPIFNHVGESLDYPKPCNCSYFHEYNITSSSSNATYNLCNMFKFLTGVLFYNTSDPLSIFHLTQRYTMAELEDYSFYPMFLASVWGLNSPYRDYMNSYENRTKAYDFCLTPSGLYCSFLTFSSFDLRYPTYDISPNYYQLNNAACTDTFTTTTENWNLLIENPFAPLSQGYTNCRYSVAQVLSNEAGIAVGNVSLLMPFGVVFVLLILYLYQICSGNFIPRGYSKPEKDKALEALAITLLLARDKKLNAIQKQYQFKRARENRDKLTKSSDNNHDSTNNTADFSRDSELEEDISNVDLNLVHSLVDELSYVGLFSREEYFRIKEEELKFEKAAINWSNLYDAVARRCAKKPQVWSDVITKTSAPTDSRESRRNVSNAQEDPHHVAGSDPAIELPTFSVLHSSPSISSDSSHSSSHVSSSKKSVTVLNQVQVNQKISNKYRLKVIKFKSTQLIIEPEPVRSNSSVATSERGGTLISVDLDSLQRNSQLMTAVNANNSSIDEEEGKPQFLFGRANTIASSPSQSKYNSDIVHLLIDYWIPKLDHWIEGFRVIVNPQAANHSSKFWILASNTSELQLFNIMSKNSIQSFYHRFEALQLEPERIAIDDVSIILVFTAIYEKIKELMICHASLALQCSMELVESKHDRKVGYLLGDELWTLFDLHASIATLKHLRELLEAQLAEKKVSVVVNDGEMSSDT